MKRIAFIPFLIVFFLSLYSCGVPGSGNNAVVLDGPILEGVGKNGDIEFNGAVINTSADPVKNIYVVIILKDVNGKIIQANSVNVMGNDQGVLLPSESAFFTVTFDSDISEVHTKEVEIYYDNINDTTSPDSTSPDDTQY